MHIIYCLVYDEKRQFCPIVVSYVLHCYQLSLYWSTAVRITMHKASMHINDNVTDYICR